MIGAKGILKGFIQFTASCHSCICLAFITVCFTSIPGKIILVVLTKKRNQKIRKKEKVIVIAVKLKIQMETVMVLIEIKE